jgi:adenine-specific DNA methylase
MTAIFLECQRVVDKKNGRLIFTFHHWNPKAWIALTLALQAAKFRLVNRYVVFSENPISVHINNMKSLLHDVVLVLAPQDVGVVTEWPEVTAVDLHDSEQFCRDCGSLLGWALQVGQTDAFLERKWLELLNKT